ncbi:hypothetical protein PT974_05265 [Cladobotryum mycophilum]|uniref:Uncharacterized protein n=1 Tax=Cladobotryum mycophilum TaxID=491253 RepID=A0ABR0SIC1_9HYPO
MAVSSNQDNSFPPDVEKLAGQSPETEVSEVALSQPKDGTVGKDAKDSKLSIRDCLAMLGQHRKSAMCHIKHYCKCSAFCENDAEESATKADGVFVPFNKCDNHHCYFFKEKVGKGRAVADLNAMQSLLDEIRLSERAWVPKPGDEMAPLLYFYFSGMYVERFVIVPLWLGIPILVLMPVFGYLWYRMGWLLAKRCQRAVKRQLERLKEGDGLDLEQLNAWYFKVLPYVVIKRRKP